MTRRARLPSTLLVCLLSAGGCGTDGTKTKVATAGGRGGQASAGTGGTDAGTSSGARAGTSGAEGDAGGAGPSSGGAPDGAGGVGGVGGSTGAPGGDGGASGEAGTAGSTSGQGGSGAQGGGSSGGTGGVGAGGVAAGGQGGAGGTGGSGGVTTCTITAKATRSAAIPTVETVTWSTTQSDVTSAAIEFAPSAGGRTLVAPVDLGEAGYRTVLVGMKPSTAYTYRIRSTSAAGTCTSEDYTVTTGDLSGAPSLTVDIVDPVHHDKGFIVTSSGLSSSLGYIIDPDGTVVWVAPSGSLPAQPSRAHLSWDAKRFIAMSLNVMNANTGKIQSVAMDGTDAQAMTGVTASHHDFTAIPGGIATLLWNVPGTDAPCSLVEYADSGSSKTIVADMGTLYTSATFHTNAVHYYPSDDSYTLGDRNPNLFVKVTRGGKLVWQFGGSNPKDASKFFAGGAIWQVNHGHHLLGDGTFVFYNNATAGKSSALIYKLDTQTMQATQQRQFTGVNSLVLGDAQALPNGNILVTGSTTGVIQELTTAGSVVMTISTPAGQQFGYSEFRESLYGPPPY